MAGTGQLITCSSKEDLEQNVTKGYNEKKLVVVAFMDSWSGASRFIQPYLVQLARKMQNVLFLKVDVDELQSLAADWNVEAKPTFKLTKGPTDNKNLATVVGAKKYQLLQTILKNMPN